MVQPGFGETLPTAILLMGPTASGKTDLAIELCERLGCELISVDSAMVYRGMDIGTAKPSAEEQARAPHRLIDIRDPAEPYSAVEFRNDALAHINEIAARGRIPLLAGGTMLYFRVLTRGVAEMPAAQPEIRQALADLQAERGSAGLHAELARVDPESAARLHPNDPQRLLRALEVFRATGRPMGEHWRAQVPPALPFRPLNIGLVPGDRRVLHERIARRFDSMLAAGFVDEVQALRARGDLHAELPSIRSVGYRQFWQGLDQGLGLDAMREQGIVATRQLAKRQMTWLRGWPECYTIDALSSDILTQALKIVRDNGT
ncbi:tRNA (adenosine(37)-N6)-dimethylallyltransferase MiaA [Kushneria phosphatilytica]|uniref:tRNA dimethylallyltransferase n=1 Tax=Kushneria phosphatilytica TaxID=657387 RepID=A0A1S1NUV4_9GAMM|nr:tRNA (adenosine(37)-N6)-dimethylallyltransferase MiaA [Kushneria phosphatilytica]OHV09965.1 tRNA (adenosine(37)-N6)-dimethylallyltransferase MiaA [Kushneria phosphatilytica]QEL11645.1 tRNA (adenosine(37)-N6)-dimethylallyltransferase MiaA [Kushneria phosphatilytica]